MMLAATVSERTMKKLFYAHKVAYIANHFYGISCLRLRLCGR